jgi:hypothetical protein
MRHKPILFRRSLLAGGALLAAPSIVRAQGTNGVALVIGNSKYQWEAQLGNVKRDAPDIAKAFQAKGLKTELLQDLTRDAFQQAVSKFKAAASGANLAAFYYAGHGASWDKDTYLVPVDADLSTPNAVKTLLPVRDVTAAMKDAANRLLVFDSCRNNPADGWRQLAAERSAFSLLDQEQGDTPPNSLTLYSTAPGRVALDGPAGQNSPFARALLNEVGVASVDLAALPKKVRRSLLIASEGRQVVWDSNTYAAPFMLSGSKAGNSDVNVPRQGGDPANAIELPNAYLFAQKNKFYIPSGLIAYRAKNDSPNARKVGSYEFTVQTPVGPSPFLLIVLSVDDQGTAQLVVVVQNDAGKLWRFITAQISGNRLSFRPSYGRPEFVLDWRDANYGSVAQLRDSSRPGGPSMTNVRFSRLDG